MGEEIGRHVKQEIIHFTLLVEDYDAALAFYSQKLNFEVLEDTDLGEGKRWVVVSPPGAKGAALLLAKASDQAQTSVVGNQAGGRVGFFLRTDDIQRDVSNMRQAGIEFIREPMTMEYGTVAVFVDLYGNQWDLLQLSDKHSMYSRG